MSDEITLEGITLPIDLEWSDRFKHSPVNQTLKRTVANTLVRVEEAVPKGRFITLIATENSGWIDLTTYNLLLPYYEAPYTTMTLVYREVFTGLVAFRHSDSPALDLDFIVGGKSPNDLLVGQIKLITVEA